MKYSYTVFLVLMVSFTALFAQVNLENGLLGYYKFNEVVDDTLVPNYATGDNIAPDGVLKLGTPAIESGVEGNAFHFQNGGNAPHVSLGDFDPSAENGGFSISLWMRWDGPTFPGWHGLVAKRDAWGDSSQIYWSVSFVDGVGTIQFETWWPDINDKYALVTPSAPPVGEWMHFALLFDGEYALMFFDGELVQEGLMYYGSNPAATFVIGALQSDGDNGFAGAIDEFRVYNRLLSDAEIAELGSGFNDPTNSELSDISVSSGNLDFIRGVFNYGVAIPKGLSTVNVSGSIKAPGAKIISGTGNIDVSSGTGSTTIVVVSSDESDTSRYVVDFVALDQKFAGDIIGHESSWGNDPAHYIDAAFDGILSTFVDAPSAEGYVGLDLGEGNNAIVTAVRYAPRSGYTARIVGGEIRGANSEDLSDAATLFTISEEPAVDYMSYALIEGAAAYRYIYYYSAAGYCNIGELELRGTFETVTTTLKHSYTFEDGTANDAVGSAHGTFQDNAAVVDGKLVLTGGYVSLPAETINVPAYPTISVEVFFVQEEGLDGFTVLYNFGTYGGYGSNYFLFQPTRNDGENSRVSISCLNTSNPWATENGVNAPEINDANFHHQVTVLTGSVMKYYLDGELVGTDSLGGNNSLANVSTDDAFIGRSVYSGDPIWRGSVEELNIYSGELSADTIFAHAAPYVSGSNSELSNITVSEGTLNFIAGVTAYGVVIPKGTSTVQVSGTVKFEGATIISGEGSIDVSSGTGSTTLVVVSADESDTTKYTVDFTALDPQITSETIIGHESSWGDNPDTYIDAAFDGDMGTFVDAPNPFGFVGLDLGPTTGAILTAVRYAPRAGFPGRMVGGKIMGANLSGLTDADTLYTITEEPAVDYMTVAMIEHTGAYQFIYYYSENGYCDIAELEFYGTTVTNIDIESDASKIPTVYALEQNFPNPFNPETNIRFSLPKAGKTTLKIYNTLGQLVATLIDRNMQAGEHTATFDAVLLPSGVYFYQIQSGNFAQVRKMILLK